MQEFLFAVNVTAPILLMMLAGSVFKRMNWLSDSFITVSNKLVFNVCLPCILFFSIAAEPITESLDTQLISFAAVSIILATIVLRLVAIPFVEESRRGVFVQGAFRGNMAIVGIAYVLNTFGDDVLARASVYVALMTLLYNILAVWVLRSGDSPWLKGMIKNPLILSVLAGVLWTMLSLPVPQIARTTGGYFAQITLPLALLCTGATLNLKSLNSNRAVVAWAVLAKLVLVPVAITSVALVLGFRGEALGILFLMMATPSAAASYIMAAQMTNHAAMAAEIIALTTVLSLVSVTAGLVVLKTVGWI